MKKYTNEFLLNELKRFYEENNRNPTEKDFEKNKNFPNSRVYFNHFGSWNNALALVNLKANHIQTKLTGEEQCEICESQCKDNRWNYKDNKRICDKCYHSNRNYLHGILDPNSNTGMGVITENIVYKILGDCEKCNTKDNFCSDYDLISEKYGNINVKSSKLYKNSQCNSFLWKFKINKTAKKPDNYICIGFNEDRTEILRVWIIDGNSKLITKGGIMITNSNRGLQRAKKYEVNSNCYDEVYQNLDIYTLSEFRNLNKLEILYET